MLALAVVASVPRGPVTRDYPEYHQRLLHCSIQIHGLANLEDTPNRDCSFDPERSDSSVVVRQPGDSEVPLLEVVDPL